MTKKEPHSRWTDPPSPALIIDRDGNVVYPTDPVEAERALAVQKAWDEFFESGCDAELKSLGVFAKD